ncbi:MAG: sugar phosphate isomerase/epimerase [Candidatus Yanofskybacteria bacterium]|nr:sugar phosphate isomerase/epimerase [Candidatus Yanofskybacteria bacterium]
MANKMRVGTLLNTFKLIPKILQDTLFSDPHLHHPLLRRRMGNILLKLGGRCLSGIYHGPQMPPEKLLSMFNLENQIEELRNAGAEHFELDDDIVFLRPEITQWWQNKIPYLSQLKDEGITFSEHLSQFGGLQVDSFIPEIRQASVQAIGRMVKLFEPLQPLNYVLHLGGDRFFRYLNTHAIDPVLRQELDKIFPHSPLKKYALRKFIQGLVWWTQHHVNDTIVVPSVLETMKELKKIIPAQNICLENLEHSDFDMMADIVTKQIDARICFDVGHDVIRNGFEHPKRFILKYGHKIAQLHLHDIRVIASTIYPSGYKEPVYQDHKPLGDGSLNLKNNILIPLKEVGFSGPIVIEDYYHDPLPSVKILRKAIDEIS